MRDNDIDVRKVAAPGVAAGSAYLLTMWLDNRLSSYRYNDIKLVGQLFTIKAPAWVVLGVVNHYAFSILVTLAYVRWGYHKLPGPGWLRGILFLQLENALLYPLAVLVEPWHAGVRSGQVPGLFSRKSWQGQALRHIAFGLVLGLMYGRNTKTV